MAEEKARLYPNECVKRVVAFVPEGHIHTRFLIELCDQKIILHEAAVAAIVRAYTMVALHPTRRAAELILEELPAASRKHGFAKWQLIESARSEEEILKEAINSWLSAEMVKPDESKQ